MELTRWKRILPNRVAMVGNMRPPQMVRVNETGSELDANDTVGMRGRY